MSRQWDVVFSPEMLGNYKEVGVLVKDVAMLKPLAEAHQKSFGGPKDVLNSFERWWGDYIGNLVLYFHENGACQYSDAGWAEREYEWGNKRIFWCRCVLPFSDDSCENVKVGDLL